MADTLGTMRASVLQWYKGDDDPTLINDMISDAVESLWDSVLLVNLGQIMGGPIQNITFSAGNERQEIVSITDPTVAPTINTVVLGALLQRTLVFGYTFVTESGSETKLSPTSSQVVPVNSVAKVLPPVFPGTPAAIGSVPIGWNVYGADVIGRLAKQNPVPLDFAQFYQEPTSTGVIDEPNQPSPPQTNTTADDIFYIRLLEVQNQDSTWTRWQGADLESLLMKRMSRAIAPSSTYYPYAWDFVNGNRIEIRPAAGQALNPRFFYTRKPRRLRFDAAAIPFTNISATEFIRLYALASLHLTNRDYSSHNVWNGKAERKRMDILKGLNTQQRVKQTRITPFLY